LSAQLAFGADLAGHTGDFRGEAVELIDHCVDRVLQFENLAFDLDSDLTAQVAARDRRRDVGDVAYLPRQVVRHEIDVVGEILPHTGHARHLGLAAEFSLRADFAGHAADFASEAIQLVDHGVDGVLQLQNLTAHGDGDLFGKVAIGHRCRDVSDVAYLCGE